MSKRIDLQLCEAATPEAVTDYPDRYAEWKLDGVRVCTDEGRLFTRNGNDVTASFPEIDAPEDHIIDGELITGDFRFESVLRRVQTEDRFKVELLADKFPAVLVAFDVIMVNGGFVVDQPLRERKELLEPSIPEDSGIVPITVHDDAEALWQQAVEEDREGIVLKDPEASYESGRSDAWVKVKNWQEDTFTILDTEYTENDGFVIYLDIGTDEPQKCVVNGDDNQAAVQNGADRAEIQFLERSPDDRLRKPSFKGVA